MITLYARQKKRHRCIEQTFGLYGRRRGWDDLREQHQTCILSSVKQIASPGWMHETSARGWCTGMTQRDGMGRKVGGGFRMGTHVNPWLIHVNVWQNPLQYCKVISLQLIKIIGGKKKNKNNQISEKNASGLANRSLRWVTIENCQRTLKDWKGKRPASSLQIKQVTQNLTFPPLTDKNCRRGFARCIEFRC